MKTALLVLASVSTGMLVSCRGGPSNSPMQNPGEPTTTGAAEAPAPDKDLYKWLETPDFSRTSAKEKKESLESVERRIETVLRGFGPIEAARVAILNQSDRASWGSTDSDAGASVVLRCKPGSDLSTKEVGAIASVLQGAVKGLKPAGILITEAGTGRLFPVPQQPR